MLKCSYTSYSEYDQTITDLLLLYRKIGALSQRDFLLAQWAFSGTVQI